MTNYTIEHANGDSATATSMTGAIAAARRMLGGSMREIPGGGFEVSGRVYRGAEYRTDRPSASDPDEREYVDALDIWAFRKDATQQSDAQAPVVISWAR